MMAACVCVLVPRFWSQAILIWYINVLAVTTSRATFGGSSLQQTTFIVLINESFMCILDEINDLTLPHSIVNGNFDQKSKLGIGQSFSNGMHSNITDPDNSQ